MKLWFHVTTTDNMNLVMLSIMIAGRRYKMLEGAAFEDSEVK